jgi:hypothetical protein
MKVVNLYFFFLIIRLCFTEVTLICTCRLIYFVFGFCIPDIFSLIPKTFEFSYQSIKNHFML